MNVYDFDKTIYDGDSTIDFYLYTLKKKPFLILLLPYSVLYFILYKLHIVSKHKFKEVFFFFVKYINDLEKFINEFWNIKDVKIKKWYLDSKKKTDIIISASPEFLLKPICDKLNVNLIATIVDPKTGKIEGENCYGENKVIRFKEYTTKKINKFYSDSYSDNPMALISKKAYIVNKNDINDWNIDNHNKLKHNKIKYLYKKYEEIINYILVGIGTMAVTLISYYLLRKFIFTAESQLHIQISNVITFILAVLFSYALNHSWVFKSNKEGKVKFQEFINFVVSRIITLILDMGLMFLLTDIFTLNDMLAKLFVQVVIVISNYIIGKFIVFKKDNN